MITHIHSYFAHGYFGGVWPFWYQYEGVPGEGVNLYAMSLTTSPPSIGQPVFHQRHSLLPTWLTVGSPSIDQGNLHQRYTLAPRSLAVGSLSIGRPLIQQRHSLTPNWLTISSPVFGHPDLHVLVEIFGTMQVVEAPDVVRFWTAMPKYEARLLEGRADSIEDITGRGGKRRLLN